MSVVAEGIETSATSALVQSAGCDRGQGFLFGTPEDLTTTRALLSTHWRHSHSA
jgi:EAL domain-containing protein (putative c-di-GMP-specific phosphodiesterase class I)